MPKKRSVIGEETSLASVGPLCIDVVMARRAGWSEEQIGRAYRQIGRLSRREGALAHRNGPVKGCPCIVCDPRVSNEDIQLAEGRFPSWRAQHRATTSGLWEWERRAAPRRPRRGIPPSPVTAPAPRPGRTADKKEVPGG